MRPLLPLLLAIGCAPAEDGPAALAGELGFEVSGAIALVCPPDFQGNFAKVFVEGTASATTCDMDQARQIPLTCEDRRAYLQAVPPVCLGTEAVAGPHLPMLDYLLELDGGGWADFGYVPLVTCVEGEETRLSLWGETTVSEQVDGGLHLDLDLYDEDGEAALLSGSVDVARCPDP